jgi:Domain of unknown function (DUF1772)
MLAAIQVASIVLTALAMAPALAHAFEFPGKKRLDRDGYVLVQGIFYPGFTLLGFSEPCALIAIVVLLFLTPGYTPVFWLTTLALLCILAMQAVYWIFTHPTNKYWLGSSQMALGAAGNRFFSVGSAAAAEDWKKLRDRWEYSHIARAGLSFSAFTLITLATVLFDSSRV